MDGALRERYVKGESILKAENLFGALKIVAGQIGHLTQNPIGKRVQDQRNLEQPPKKRAAWKTSALENAVGSILNSN